MKFAIEKNRLSVSPAIFMRQAGYAIREGNQGYKDSYMRFFGNGNYPRFHAYIDETADQYIVNLHFDQKKPSYQGVSAHSGEYDGELVEEEIARLKQFIR